ncbi:MAG: hypothetical protein FWJ87_15405 [Micromonosporaceae bacterium]
MRVAPVRVVRRVAVLRAGARLVVVFRAGARFAAVFFAAAFLATAFFAAAFFAAAFFAVAFLAAVFFAAAFLAAAFLAAVFLAAALAVRFRAGDVVFLAAALLAVAIGSSAMVPLPQDVVTGHGGCRPAPVNAPVSPHVSTLYLRTLRYHDSLENTRNFYSRSSRRRHGALG